VTVVNKKVRNNVESYLNSSYSIRLPSNLDLDKLLEKSSLTVSFYEKNPKRITDRLAFIIHQIHTRQAISKDLDVAKSNRYVNLQSNILETLVKDYRLVLQ